MASNSPENHPWMKTFTVMSVLYVGVQGLFSVSSAMSGWEIIFLILFSGAWVYTGIYLIRETDWFRNWSTWVYKHQKMYFLAYYYMAPGVLITFFFLAIPFIVIRGIGQGFRDIS